MKKFLLFSLMVLCYTIGILAQTKTVTFQAKGLTGDNLSFSVELWDNNDRFRTSSHADNGVVAIELPDNIGTFNYAVTPFEEYINDKDMHYVSALGSFDVNETATVSIDYAKAKKVSSSITYPGGYSGSNGGINIKYEYNSYTIDLGWLESSDYYILPNTYEMSFSSDQIFPMEKTIIVKESDSTADIVFDLSAYKKLSFLKPATENASFNISLFAKDTGEDGYENISRYVSDAVYVPVGKYMYEAQGEVYNDMKTLAHYLPEKKDITVSSDMQVALFKDYVGIPLDVNFKTENKDGYINIFRNNAMGENLMGTSLSTEKIYMPAGTYYMEADANGYCPDKRTFTVTKDAAALKIFENYYTLTLNEKALPEGLRISHSYIYKNEEDYQKGNQAVCNFMGNKLYMPAMTCFLNTNFSGSIEGLHFNKALTMTGDMTVDCKLDVTLQKVTIFLKDIDGTPMGDASVSVRNKDKESSYIHIDNQEVKATFLLPEGEYSYEVTKHNYLPLTGRFTVKGSSQTIDASFAGYRQVSLKIDGVDEDAYSNFDLYLADGDYSSFSFDSEHTATAYMPDGTYRYRLVVSGYMEKFGNIEVSATSTAFTFDYSDEHYVSFNVEISDKAYSLDGIYLNIDGERKSINSHYDSETGKTTYGMYLTDGNYTWGYRFVQEDGPDGYSKPMTFTVNGADAAQTAVFDKGDYCKVTAILTNIPDVSAVSVDEEIYFEGGIALTDGNNRYGMDFYGGDSYHNTLSDELLLPKADYSYETDSYVSDDVTFAAFRGTVNAKDAAVTITCDMEGWKHYALNVKDAATQQGIPYVSGIIADKQKQTVAGFGTDDDEPIITYHFYAPQADYTVKTVAKGYRSKETTIASTASSVDILMTKGNVYSVFFEVYSVAEHSDHSISGATVTLEGYGNAVENAYIGAYYVNDVPVSDTPIRYTVTKTGYQTVTGTVIVNDANFDDDYAGISVYVQMFPDGSSIEQETPVTVRAYPNPTADYLYLDGLDETENWKTQVYATDGTMVISKEVNDLRIDLSELNSGIYYVRLFSDNRNISLKVIRK